MRLIIHAVNAAALVVILIGFPVISSMQMGHLQLSSAPQLQRLTLWGFAVAAGGNFMTILLPLAGKKPKAACRNWALVHGGLWIFEWLLYSGRINFDWLKDALLWLKSKLQNLR